jgi:hypothetical protein
VDRRLEELIARHQIADATLRYCRGIDRLDLELMKSAYHDDAVDHHGVFDGPAMEFCERVISTHDRFLNTMHLVANHHITALDLDAGTAEGELYNLSFLRVEGEIRQWWGRYVDRYEHRDGPGWRIAHRVCVHEFTHVTPDDAPMPMRADLFRQGGWDRAVPRPAAQ